MPYLISFVWYPLSQSDTVAQRYLEMLQKLPVISSIKRIVPAATAATKEGIEAIVVDEVKREDLGEANDYLSRFLIEFRDIEGFNFHIRSFSTVSEALAYVGMG
ncbi:MAG: hypothetical protein ACFFFT_05905 [Candidatus Thorarchaeota archaeon]